MVKSQRMVTKVYLGDLHIGDGTFETDFEYDNELADLIESLVISGCSELVIVGDGLELVNSNEVKSSRVVALSDSFEVIDIQTHI